MKVLMLTSSFPLRPGDTTAGPFVEAFCQGLLEQGHEVTVVTQDRPEPGKQPIDGIDVHWFPWRGSDRALAYLKPYKPLDFIRINSLLHHGWQYVDKLASEQSFDHVFAMWAVPAGWFAKRVKAKHGLPMTVWCLGSDIWTYGRYPILKAVVAGVLREADLLYADGDDLCKQAEILGGRPCAFMATSRKLDKSLAKAVNVIDRATGPRFYFVGRYAPVKGVDVMLEAMAQYHARGGKGHLYMFGGGPLDEFVRERAAKPDLAGCVTVGGYADESICVSYLSACDCALIPSRMESIPVALSDALQMGVPVIVTSVGDMGELVGSANAGIVVPPAEADALCDALLAFEGFERDGATSSAFDEGVAALAKKFEVAQSVRQWATEAERFSKSDRKQRG